jgi:antitoxin component YwqK of YwqJK toxin-antitoxin module
MKRNISITVACLVIGCACFAQSDSSIIYISKEGKPTVKDSAYMYEVVTKKDNVWHGKTYFIKSKSVQSEGNYTDAACELPIGTFNNYEEDGSLFSTISYDNGKPLEATLFYKNGKKKCYIAYSNNNISQQKGWDENGNEIPNYIVQREARFKGGADGWLKYLQKHLNGDVASDAGAPAGAYTVIVEFLVNKEGYISNVKAIYTPEKCKACAAEAVSVIMNGPNWEPAIQYNVPVIYRQKQSVTFEVVDKKRKKN